MQKRLLSSNLNSSMKRKRSDVVSEETRAPSIFEEFLFDQQDNIFNSNNLLDWDSFEDTNTNAYTETQVNITPKRPTIWFRRSMFFKVMEIGRLNTCISNYLEKKSLSTFDILLFKIMPAEQVALVEITWRSAR